MRTAKLLVTAGVIFLVAGCKLAVINVEGGEVWLKDSGTCFAETICIIDVPDTNFSERIGAVPNEGWYFHKWNSGGKFLYGNNTDAMLQLSFDELEGNDAIQKLVASSETFYIMPVFKPRQDIIYVDGKEWLQPDLFLGLKWNEINAVCPKGACSGILNGRVMDGWTWASVEDITTLFNYYITRGTPGSGTWSFAEVNSEWAQAFFSDGWMPISFPYSHDEYWYFKSIDGWLHGLDENNNAYQAWILYVAGPDDDPYYDRDRVEVTSDEIRGEVREDRGGWFYRMP